MTKERDSDDIFLEPEGPQATDGVMRAKDVAAFTLAALEMERFLILPAPRRGRAINEE